MSLNSILGMAMFFGSMLEGANDMFLDMEFRLPRKTKKKFKAWLLRNESFSYDRGSFKYFKQYSRNK